MTAAPEWQGPVGDVWAEEWRRTDRAFAGLSPSLEAAILAAAPAGSFRAVDLGCGAGWTSLALSDARPDAAIYGVDLSPALIAVARGRAGERGGVTFEMGDACTLAIADAPFDLIVSRHGVMFFPNPAAAFTMLRDAASEKAGLVFSCFGDPEENGFAVPLARALDLTVPATGAAPGPFAFADPGYVEALLTGAGWREVSGRPVSFPYRVGTGDDALDDAVSFLSRIGPAAAAMRGVDDARRAELRARLKDYLAPYVTDEAVDLPASAWLWSARA